MDLTPHSARRRGTGARTSRAEDVVVVFEHRTHAPTRFVRDGCGHRLPTNSGVVAATSHP
jgi:hypothetical protein